MGIWPICGSRRGAAATVAALVAGLATALSPAAVADTAPPDPRRR